MEKMAEPKAKTLQQKLGFFDEDLKKPLHDDILKWVSNNAEKIIYETFPSLKNWSKDQITKMEQYSEFCIEYTKGELSKTIIETEKKIERFDRDIKYYSDKIDENDDHYNKLQQELVSQKTTLENEIIELKKKIESVSEKKLQGELPIRQSIKVIDKIWEFPVTSQSSSTTGYISSKNIVGFIDLKITFQYPQLSLTGIDFKTRKIADNIRWSQSMKKINLDYGNDEGISSHSIYFEIKTKIPSLGELFRQLRMYKEYINADYIIVCPDDSERKLIEEQGFKFVKYEL